MITKQLEQAWNLLVIPYNTWGSDGLSKLGKYIPLNKECLFVKGLQEKKLCMARCDSSVQQCIATLHTSETGHFAVFSLETLDYLPYVDHGSNISEDCDSTIRKEVEINHEWLQVQELVLQQNFLITLPDLFSLVADIAGGKEAEGV